MNTCVLEILWRLKKLKTKTTSVRLPENMYEEIDNVCNDIGCTRNDWIKDTLKGKLRNQLGENITESTGNPPRPEFKNIRVSSDGGKTWYENGKQIPKPEFKVARISLDNGKTWYENGKLVV